MSTSHKPSTPGAKRPDLFGAAPAPRTANPATEMRIDVLAALDPEAPKPSADKRRTHIALAVFAISFIALGTLGFLTWRAPAKPEAETTLATAEEKTAPAPTSEPPAAAPAPAQEAVAPAAAPASIEPIAEAAPAQAAEAPASQAQAGNPLGTLSASPDTPAQATPAEPARTPSAAHQAAAAPRQASHASKGHPAPVARKHSGVLSALTAPQAGAKGRTAPDTDVILLEALISNPASKAIATPPGAKKNGQSAAARKPVAQHGNRQTRSGTTIAPEYQSAAQMVVTKATEAAENKASEAASQKASEAGGELLNKLTPAQ